MNDYFTVWNSRDIYLKVPEQEVQEWCQNNGNIPYIETSAKEGTNVEKAFQLIAQQSVKDIGNS